MGTSEGLDDDQHDDRRQQQHRNLVEPPVPHMGPRGCLHARTGCTARRTSRDSRSAAAPAASFACIQPPFITAPWPSSHMPSTTAITASPVMKTRQLTRHQQQPCAGGAVVDHRQVDVDARQVEQAREPGDDEHDVQRLNPQVRVAHAMAGSEEASAAGLRADFAVPNTTYFSEVRPSSPTGPRACSLSLEMPISAPRPYSKPSAKRVEAFTITDAESTSRRKRMARRPVLGDDRVGVLASRTC